MNNLSQILNSADDGAAPSLASADRLDGCGVLFSWRTVWGNAARGVGGIQTSAKSRHVDKPREHRLGVLVGSSSLLSAFG